MNRLMLLCLCVVAALPAADPPPVVSAVVPWADCEGYTPVVMTIGSPSERTISITVTSGTSTAKAQVAIGAGQAVRTTVLLPPIDDQTPHVRIVWTSDDGLDGESYASPSHSHRETPLVVIDADERIPLKSFDFTNSTDFASQRSSSRSHAMADRIAITSLPERWQGFPTWMTLVFAPNDDRALSSDLRSAIATWVAAGGAVAVAEPSQREAWRRVGVEPLLISNEADMTERLNLLARDPGSSIPTDRVPGTESVPATGFMILATLFALVVGPLNLWWVKRKGLPALFLVTTPILSLATCIVLLGANVFIEGLSLRRVAFQVTLLDQRQARAITWSRITYYGGFTVGSIAVDPDAKVRRFEAEDQPDWRYGYRRRWNSQSVESRTIDWRGGQALTGEWIPARRNRQLLYAAARSERNQLQIAREAEGWRVTNGLGVAIRQLVWRDGAGRIHHGGPIPVGDSALLSAGDDSQTLADGFESRFGLAVDRAITVHHEPGGFIAELDGAFGGLPGPDGVDAVPLTSHVVGRILPGGAP